jgi:CBS domain-containing protein/ribosome-associated translation inhibitor RaiA
LTFLFHLILSFEKFGPHSLYKDLFPLKESLQSIKISTNEQDYKDFKYPQVIPKSMVDVKSIITSDFSVFDEDTSLAEVVAQLQNFEKRAGLVFRKNKYLGLVEKKNLMKSSLDLSKVKVRGLVRKTPIINSNLDVQEAAQLMFNSDSEYLPVEENKKIVGVVSSLDLAKICLDLPEMKGLRVADIKLIKPSKVDQKDSLGKALSIMQEEAVDHLPVFNDGQVSGILSFRDVLRKYLNWSPSRDYSSKFNAKTQVKIKDNELPKLSELPIEDFSTNSGLISVSSQDLVKKAILAMVDNKIHDVLVMEFEKDFKGMLTIRHLLKKVGTMIEPKNYNLRFVGLKESNLKPYQKYSLQELAKTEAVKLQRKLRQELNISIHLKAHGKKDSGRENFSVTLKMVLSKGTVISTHDEWDPEIALRSAFEHAEEEALRKVGKQMARDKQIY